MDEVARQLPSTLGHTPAESEEEEGTSLRDLRDESRLGDRNNNRNTHATKIKCGRQIKFREMMKDGAKTYGAPYLLRRYVCATFKTCAATKTPTARGHRRTTKPST